VKGQPNVDFTDREQVASSGEAESPPPLLR
jgi:hypothetical protein